jgi:intergrase/recombinase
MIDWVDFKSYLSKNYRHGTMKVRLCYAKRYAAMLEKNSEIGKIQQLPPHSRLHAMKALTTLSKYLGCYDSWLQTRKRYNMKWTTGNESLQALHRFFDDSLSLDVMMAKVKEMIRLLGGFMGQIVKFAVLTGLRPGEVIESVKLLAGNNKFATVKYYNEERQALEHFRFPEIFLRKTKKAYISFVTTGMIEEVVRDTLPQAPSYTAIRQACRKKGIYCNIAYCRKIFASWLSKEGISDIMIDMLQGRTPRIVLVQHYLTPTSDYRQKVLAAVAKLKSELEV